MADIKNCWVVVEDGLTGTENQCLGVAEALGVEPIVKRITLNLPWKFLSPYLGFEQSWSFQPWLEPPYPDLLIAGGRKSIGASKAVRRMSGGKTFTVQLQDPKISARHFDLVAVPHHDSLRGDNVIVTDGACNRITDKKLQKAKADFADRFEKLPSPRVAVLIGGNSKTHTLTEKRTKELVDQLKALNAGLMITASRRTGEDNTAILKDGLKSDHIYFWDGSGDNPYHGMLAWADYILVTEDSVSMISDAATTGKPVYIVEMDGGSPKFTRFKDHMRTKGVITAFNGNLEPFSYERLNDAQKVAEAVIKRLK